MKSLSMMRIALLAAFVVGGVACQRTQPAYEVRNVPMNTPPGATLMQVGAAIKQAGAGIGWQFVDQAPGFIRGKYSNQRDQTVEVDIQYDTRTFSIFNAGMQGIRTTGTGEVQSGYNRWIQNLEQKILAQTSAISVYPMAPGQMAPGPMGGGAAPQGGRLAY